MALLCSRLEATVTTSPIPIDRARIRAAIDRNRREYPRLPLTSSWEVAEVMIEWWAPSPPRFDPVLAGAGPDADIRQVALDALVDRAAASFGISDWVDERRDEARDLVASVTGVRNDIHAWALSQCIRPPHPRVTYDEVFGRDSRGLRNLSRIRDRLRRTPRPFHDLDRAQASRIADWIDDYLGLMSRIGPRLKERVRKDTERRINIMLATAAFGSPAGWRTASPH